MFGIGEFARLGGVSVRMLRHYDATGVLVPAHVDPSSGYRSYSGVQLGRLNRLLALKDLGFTLDQVRSILDAEVSADELRGMLRLRRAELTAQIAADTERLARVEHRLRTIESEDTMLDTAFDVTSVSGHRLAALTATVDSVDAVGPVVGPLFDRLAALLAAGGYAPSGPTVAVYDATDDGVVITAGFPVTGDLPADGPGDDGDDRDDGIRLVTLPALDTVATATFRGPISAIGDGWQALVRRAEAEGFTTAGPCREVYLATPMDPGSDGSPDGWVVALQQPVRRAG